MPQPSLDTPLQLPYVPLMQSSAQILDELFAESQAGKKSSDPPRWAFARELTEQDLILLKTHPVPAPKVSTPLVVIRTSHHMLAKLVADGRPFVECSAITGVSAQRIREFVQDDPSFQELIAHYKAQTSMVYSDAHEKLSALSLDAIEILHERILADPDSVKTSDLRGIAELALDRTGFGPKSTVNLRGGIAIFTDEAIAQVKAEASRRRSASLPSLERTPDRSALLPAGEILEAQADQRLEGFRPGLREEVHQDAGEEAA